MEDPQVRLNVLCSRKKLRCSYKEISIDGPPHDPTFIVHVYVNEENLGEGIGKSKKQAQKNAAREALEKMNSKENPPQPVEPSAFNSMAEINEEADYPKEVAECAIITANYIGMLNELCQKKAWPFCLKPTDHGGPNCSTFFFCVAEVNGRDYPLGQGMIKKDAKKMAAFLALRKLKEENPDDALIPTIPANYVREPGSASSSVSESTASGHSSSMEAPRMVTNNYIGVLNELCQKRAWDIYFKEINRYGQDHKPIFCCVAVIKKRDYPEGQGTSKKEAKKSAALVALRKLKEENPEDTLISIIHLGDSESETRSINRPNLESETANVVKRRADASTNAMHLSAAEQSPFHDFKDISNLSAGGFGKIFKAFKTMDKVYYAVKKVKMRGNCKLEVQALARLDHPNIVRYFHSWTGEDFFLDGSTSSSASSDSGGTEFLYIQMEFCKNGDLKGWISNMKTVDKRKSLEIYQQIIEGVSYIHSEKLIHRDLKPANILFATDMRVKIGDLGLVTEMTEAQNIKVTVRSQGVGTHAYMAPEQREKCYNSEVDIFPLGLILVELLLIFGSVHEKQNEWTKMRNGQLPDKFVEKYPAEEHMIKLMLSKDPKKRPTADTLKKYFNQTNEDLETRTY